MKRYLVHTLYLLILTASMLSTSYAQNDLPPIIDREIFFGNPEIAGAQLSPDGKWMSFLKPYEEVRNIWVKKADEPFEKAKVVTASTDRPIPGYFWSRDSKYILYVQDKGGDENFHVYALDPFASPKEGAIVPDARNLTDVDGVRAIIYAVPKSKPNIMYVGLNDRDPAWHDLYQVDIATGERELVRKNENQITGWIFDTKDEIRMASKTTEDGGTEILVLEGDAFKTCYTCSVLESCYIARFDKDGKHTYLVTNKGDLDLTQLMRFNPMTGKTELIEKDPKNEVDFGGAVFSDLTNEMVATVYTGEKTRIYFKDKQWNKEYEWMKKELPNVEINLGSSTKDERKWLIYANSDTDPGATYLYDRDKKKLTFQYRPRPKLPIEDLAEMRPISYPSSDGLKIPAYLTIPKGLEATNLPLVVFPHGGPWARDYWGYSSYVQFLANRGYAVLTVNFRGSTGYGKAFLNAGNNEWGQLMQDDLTWGVKHLVKEGIVDEDRVAIMGGSYGGYATLAGLTFTPDVYAAGVSIVGPSNLITLLESIPPYWESIREMFHERMGDPDTEEGKAQLIRQSPLYSADQIKVPLMVVQGANDPRVKKAESDQIVVAMRELGLPVEYICAPDEGHGFRRPVNSMAFLSAAEKFLAKHIGGRYQEEMPENIANRLAEITVDIDSVKMPEKMDDSKLNAALPQPTKDLSARTDKYNMTIAMGPQEIKMDMTQEIKSEGKYWVITQSANSMMGSLLDVATIEKESLLPVKRSVEQGPAKIDLEHTKDKISGTMSMNGKSKPIEMEKEQALFGDGAALYETLAALPLAEGYTAVYRTFDMQMQKVKAFELKVVGTEKVKVPAGEFDAYKVEITTLEDGSMNTTLWVDQSGKKSVVKSSATLPQMGGATVTSELAE